MFFFVFCFVVISYISLLPYVVCSALTHISNIRLCIFFEGPVEDRDVVVISVLVVVLSLSLLALPLLFITIIIRIMVMLLLST